MLTARLGSLHASQPDAESANARWWVSMAEAAEVLVELLSADDQASPGSTGVDLLSRQPWIRINLAQGGVSAQGMAAGDWWLAANGGRIHRHPWLLLWHLPV